MILLNELNGDIILKPNIRLSGALKQSIISLKGNIKNGGALTFPEYHGTYEVTPSDDTQILSTKNTRLTDDIVVNPIPSNYGKITWDGSILTVS